MNGDIRTTGHLVAFSRFFYQFRECLHLESINTVINMGESDTQEKEDYYVRDIDDTTVWVPWRGYRSTAGT